MEPGPRPRPGALQKSLKEASGNPLCNGWRSLCAMFDIYPCFFLSLPASSISSSHWRTSFCSKGQSGLVLTLVCNWTTDPYSSCKLYLWLKLQVAFLSSVSVSLCVYTMFSSHKRNENSRSFVLHWCMSVSSPFPAWSPFHRRRPTYLDGLSPHSSTEFKLKYNST